MKSYLEVTGLMCTLVCYVSWHLASILTQNKCFKHQIIKASVFTSMMCILFHQKSFLVFLILFCILSFQLVKWKLLYWIESLLIYFVLISSIQFHPEMMVSDFLVYADASSLDWIGMMTGICLLDFLAEHILASVFKKSDLMIPVKISIQGKEVECIGYYDTGNLCMHESKPVIFLRFPFLCETVLKIKGIGREMMVPAAEAVIEINGISRNVTAAYVKDLQVECLLHRSMR